MNTTEIKKANQKRYRLHRKIRKEGYDLKTRKRTIYFPFTQTEFSDSVLLLRDYYGYSLQSEIE